MPRDPSFLQSGNNPFLNRDQPSLETILERVQANETVASGRRKQHCSSLRAVGRVLGLPLNTIPAHRRWLRERLAKAEPRRVNMSPKRFANARSDLWAALELAGIGRNRKAYLAPLTSDWKSLWDQIEREHLRWRLKRIMSFCSYRAIEPGAVDESTFDLFKTALHDEGWVDNPDQTTRTAINAWNTAQATVPGWPDRTISRPPSARRGWTLALEDFRDSFQADVANWLRTFRGEDELGLIGPERRPSEKTVTHRLFQIRMMASALVRKGHPIEAITSLTYIVDIEHFKDGMRFLIDRYGKPTESIHGLAIGIRYIAEHHVKVSVDHLEALKRLCRQLDLETEGLREKTRRRLLQFEDPVNVRLLLNLPHRLLELAQEKERPDRSAARLVELAVAIEILTFTGLRLKNLSELDIERHFQWFRTGMGEVLQIMIPREQAKMKRRPIVHELDAESLVLVREYLDRYRPLLLPGPSTYLFPGRYGGHKAPSGFGERIKRTIRKHTGLVVNVHLFRSLAGKFHLGRDPGDYETVRQVLGHASLTTTTAAYTQFEAQSARRHYRETVRLLRDALPPARGGRGTRGRLRKMPNK